MRSEPQNQGGRKHQRWSEGFRILRDYRHPSSASGDNRESPGVLLLTQVQTLVPGPGGSVITLRVVYNGFVITSHQVDDWGSPYLYVGTLAALLRKWYNLPGHRTRTAWGPGVRVHMPGRFGPACVLHGLVHWANCWLGEGCWSIQC